MKDKLFERIEQKTNVKKDDILSFARSIQGVDLKDETNLRKIIKDVAKMAGKDISKEKEDKIVDTVKKDKIPKNINNVI